MVWLRELLAIGLWEWVPAVVALGAIGGEVQQQVTYLPEGNCQRVKVAWAGDLERFSFFPVEVAAGLTAAGLVFVAVAVLRAWRRGRA